MFCTTKLFARQTVSCVEWPFLNVFCKIPLFVQCSGFFGTMEGEWVFFLTQKVWKTTNLAGKTQCQKQIIRMILREFKIVFISLRKKEARVKFFFMSDSRAK